MLLLATVYGSPNNLVIIHNLWPLFPKHTTSTSTKSHGSKVRVSAKASATRSAIRCGPPFRSPAQRPRRSPTQRADSAPMTSEEDVAGCVKRCEAVLSIFWDLSQNPSKGSLWFILFRLIMASGEGRCPSKLTKTFTFLKVLWTRDQSVYDHFICNCCGL